MLTIVIATHNNHKVVELLRSMESLPITWVTLKDLQIDTIIEEDGTSIDENATLKAQEYARLTGMYTLSDDSGLTVDALNGRPGVHSSRYGEPNMSSKQQRALLLNELYDISWNKRQAQFRCTLVLAHPYSTDLNIASGICQGLITTSDRGTGGFGYDPIFYIPDQSCTMAEMSSLTKNRVGHRGKATLRMKIKIANLISRNKISGANASSTK